MSGVSGEDSIISEVLTRIVLLLLRRRHFGDLNCKVFLKQ